jgi:hypothetical protein
MDQKLKAITLKRQNRLKSMDTKVWGEEDPGSEAMKSMDRSSFDGQNRRSSYAKREEVAAEKPVQGFKEIGILLVPGVLLWSCRIALFFFILHFSTNISLI